MQYKAELNSESLFHLFKRNLYPWHKLFFIVFVSILLSSCVANKYYYPLKNDTYFQESAPTSHKAAIMPFNVGISTHYSATNTLKKREEKSRDARKFVANSIARELAQNQYDVAGYIAWDALINDKFDRETRSIIDELFHELSDANFSIGHNLEDEEGKGFDYSIGIRAREIAGLFNKDPDVLVFLNVNSFVRNLRALESDDPNSAADVMTLGMSTPDDIIYIIITLVDTDTGDIFWRDIVYAQGRSVLRPRDINFAVRDLLQNLYISTVRQGMSYVK